MAIKMLQRDGRTVLLGYMTLVLTGFYFAFLPSGRLFAQKSTETA
jgi:hypothetical protein